MNAPLQSKNSNGGGPVLARRPTTQEVVIPFSEADVLALSTRLEEPGWLRERRLEAWATFEATPMPTLNDEAWRRTDLRSLRWDEVARLANGASGRLDDIPAKLRKPLIGNKQGGLLAYLNGTPVHARMADELAAQGVIFADLGTAVRQHGDLVQEFLGRAVAPERGKFAALSAALWTHGVLVYVPAGVEAVLPLHSIEYATNGGTTLTCILVVLECGAHATVLHESASPTLNGERQAVHLGITELLVGDEANLRYVGLQNWGEHLYDLGHQRALIGRDGHLDWVHGAMGTRLTKLFMDIELDGQGAWGRMSGLMFTHGRQHLDHDTQQNHNAPHTTSDLLFKVALKDHSRSVWQGMIRVLPGAQKTDGFQANRNLVLTGDARADSIPGLEIEADDVRCTHASTVGRLDENELFYLMSRGLPRRDAARLIVDGFFEPVMQRIPFEGVRERLQTAIEAKLEA
jgi:Fe-S cluster assembly protein SufD